VTVAHYLGLAPKWVDRPAVGGCSLTIHAPTPPRRSARESAEQLAILSMVQHEWAAKNPRATFKTPIIGEDVV
jgi:hypothetical protein